MINKINESITAIDAVFTDSWLSDPAHFIQDTKQQSHYIPHAWRTTRDLYNQKGYEGLIGDYEAMSLLSIGDDLAQSQGLANFREAFFETANPITDAKNFDIRYYEIRVAALFARAGVDVQFLIPEANQKNNDASNRKYPDIRINTEFGQLDIECDVMQVFITPARLSYPEDTLVNGLNSMQDELNSGHAISLLGCGAIDKSTHKHIINAAKYAIQHNEMKMLVRKDTLCGVSVREVPLVVDNDMDSPESYERMDRMMAEPGTIGGVMISEGARVERVRGYGCYIINAPKLSTVFSAFHKGHKQLPEKQSGLLFINLNFQNISWNDIPTYLELTGKIIKTGFNKKQNTRVGAVVLTAGCIAPPSILPIGSNAKPMLFYHTVRNPHSSLSKTFPLPGGFGSRFTESRISSEPMEFLSEVYI